MITVEPVASWAPSDRSTILSLPLSRLASNALGAEPIVMGARGLRGVESALPDSVSSAVVFHAKRPVLVVPHQETQPTAAGSPAEWLTPP